MQLTFEHHGLKYTCAVEEAKLIAISLDFEGPQPNHFGTDKASTSVLKLGGFIGDTESGGSCNVDVLNMIPHCNGTHTETVSHIVNEDIWVGHALEVVTVAMLVTVSPVSAKGVAESYRPPLDETDTVITAQAVQQAIAAAGDAAKIRPGAIVLRTLPNEAEKRSRVYNEKNTPPFFTVEAMDAINKLDVRHLLVDLPSVDRMYDDGLLTNHHLFWNVAEKTHELSAETWQDKTITEMIFVEDDLVDGVYALNMQLPAFCSDAAPSRPVLIPAKPIK